VSDQAGPRHYECSCRECAYFHLALFAAEAGLEFSSGHVGFAVDDLGTAHERAVGAGAEVVEERREEPWGPTVVYRDLNGNLVALTARRG
jgi:predicted enzyme related to lactoylglutathione lyase